MRSTIGSLILSNARELDVLKITGKLGELTLLDDAGESSSSNANLVSRRIPSLSTSRTQHIHIHYPRSVISSHV